MDEAKFAAWLAQNGYTQVRRLPDGSYAGVSRLLFTTALYIGLDVWGWERRYCYESERDALAALAALETSDDEPTLGYVAKRGG
ncbi:hypothetical protein [Cupriavidus alkaliphilus]|uniref:hypothetical protein n=1 Tax=Cupriavidus alkaliphilus TaxID=942866 RepID=UPI00161C46B9|nr:hypothetical protein [Cupriavidus alkaliphilus]MBB2915898.1 hypothetical protein [Cupriavidus alkaliphilus]